MSRNGLSDRGKSMIIEMNRIGMMVDLSHTNDATQIDVLEISKAPVIFSHSSCLGITSNSRNVSDQVLDMLKQNGGVIMICFLSELVTPTQSAHQEKERPTVSHAANHILYAGERIGFDHVGIGSDFDGMLHGPKDLDDVSQYPNLIAELLRRGLSDSQVRGILGLNILRVLEMVEQTARQIRLNDNVPMQCDVIAKMWIPEQEALLRQAGQARIKNYE
ncbi:hypothetical protein N7456_004169 [Penicillium angulare]|uniref:Dipeptidase n=1 Tax=Penicillium angulare TaxID=116970 RepID=A0A9W9FW44_9EURO|nr:hypothetical protein N7456_004169 [Penicillium angulare]